MKVIHRILTLNLLKNVSPSAQRENAEILFLFVCLRKRNNRRVKLFLKKKRKARNLDNCLLFPEHFLF